MFYLKVLLLMFLIQSKAFCDVLSVDQKSLMIGSLKDHQQIGEPKCMFLLMLSLKKWKERLWVLMCKHHCVTRCKRDLFSCFFLLDILINSLLERETQTMQSATPNYDKVSFAPMLDVTNTYYHNVYLYYRFQRYMMRCLTKRTTLYTEMYVAETILFSRYTDDIIEFLFC